MRGKKNKKLSFRNIFLSKSEALASAFADIFPVLFLSGFVLRCIIHFIIDTCRWFIAITLLLAESVTIFAQISVKMC